MRCSVIFFLLILLAGCKSYQLVSITGYAQECKAGAGVSTIEPVAFYFLNKVDSWEDSLNGRQITVTGRLKTKIHTASSDGVIRQEMTGTSLTLLSPHWKLTPALISISGKTINQFGQPAIRNHSDSIIYFIRQQQPWSVAQLDQSVKLSGELFIEPNMPVNIPGRNYPEIIESYRSIRLWTTPDL
ncbi:MAG: hypothetical protein J0H92_16535 [Sphingobacteriales bacterium]|nr:hypothetical protein [Sphingobacteriales bacterium]OJW37264.1 MAG: hypothetical protein BGO54_11665 [Sphingobacteriales bacterium 46-32]